MWCEIYFICCTARKSQCKGILFSTDHNWKKTMKNKYSSYQKLVTQITCTQFINMQSTQLKYLKVQARSQNLLPKNKHSLLIPNIIILILTRSTLIFFSMYLQPTPILHSRKWLHWNICHVMSSVALQDYKCWRVPITMELNVCPTDIRKLR